MASIHREVVIDCSPEQLWAVLRDFGALAQLVPGFVVGTRLEEGARIVTFGNGAVVRELLVDIDEERRRVAWSATGGTLSHHNASFQVFPEGKGTRGVWIADLLPSEAAPRIAAMIEQGLAAMKKAFDGKRGG
ncbi:hypothetical protein AKJ09_09390 [Labilithrix luteola]|uniref:Polyketide cyclase/dehydrase n=1 Tax=Labilithrix luteola TaxID=1391654 RepID=A0A0K1QAP2_9BACT|nr:SRPBCC family protein [Labilithrix luteola]AKV02727.1 hypothetical protein AKJ09_09390 [Labilithrix luteola]